MTPHIDHERLMAEIEEEVRRKRATGELPADLERELDLVFARFAPVNAIDGDFERVLTRVEESTFIDVLAPTESSRPVVPYFKRIVAKAVRWQIRYVAQQVTGVVSALAKALRLLGRRVDVLEQALPGAGGRAIGELARPSESDATVLAEWNAFVVDAMTGVSGRVLHADAGTAGLLEALVAAGVDVYGTDPSETVVLEAAARGLDVRADNVLDHLALLPDASLAGVVLSGCIDRLGIGAQLTLADRVAEKLCLGGRVVIVSSTPAAWTHVRTPMEVDLSPGHPLHSETWVALLSRRGLKDVEVRHGGPSDLLVPLPGGVAGSETMNANIERLNRMLFGPASYAVVASRGL